MAHRIWLSGILVSFLPALALASPAARPPAPATPAPVPAPAVAVTASAVVAPPVAPVSPELDRAEIFRILCGGAELQDVMLEAHLWRVAGSLAERGWTPPRVTVHVVVDPSGR